MHFVIEYEVCALLFLSTIAIQFFQRPRFPNKRNLLFGAILLCAVAALSLDILTARTIEYAAAVPLWLNMLLNQVFYFVQILLPALFFAYVLILVGRFELKKWSIRLLLLPTALCELLILSNPVTGLLFYFDGSLRYTYGIWQSVIYWDSGFYLAISTVLLHLYRARVQSDQYRAVHILTPVVAAAMVLQKLHPQYLLSGVSVALITTMVYLTLQNPEEMLDGATGAFNFDALLLFLQDRFAEAKDFQLIALDVGGMYRINSLLGLPAGNQVIGQVSGFLLGCGKEKWIFRAAGERFMVVTAYEDGYQDFLNKVRDRFEQPWRIGEADIMLSARVCHVSSALFLNGPGDVVSLMDAALSEMPEENFVPAVEIRQEFLLRVQRQLTVEAALRQALERGDSLELYLQPIYSLQKERFTTAEVLLRFFDPVLGEVSPAEFIPIAEKNGLAGRLDEWVVHQTCRLIQRHSLQTRGGLDSLGINLSAAGILQQKLPEKLIEIAESYGIAPSFLTFEITETAATTAHAPLRSYMNIMRRHGFRFALDDFGSGYANVTQAVNLPFFAVKLDRTLLARDAGGGNNAVVFEATLRMFRRLGMVTIVEGVETEEQLRCAQRLRADFIQGFYYARPMPEKAFLAALSGPRTECADAPSFVNEGRKQRAFSSEI